MITRFLLFLPHCEQVMESEEFMLLPANQLIDIISSDELNVRSEEQVFNAVMAWVKYSIQERRPQLPQVRWKCFFKYWTKQLVFDLQKRNGYHCPLYQTIRKATCFQIIKEISV